MDWLANIPPWLQTTVSVLGAVGGIALTVVLGKLGIGHGKEKAQEAAVIESSPATSNGQIPAALVGIGGALLDRSNAEAVINVGAALVAAVHKMVEATNRMTDAYERMIDQTEETEEKARMRAEVLREHETQRLRDEIENLRNNPTRPRPRS